MTEEVVRRSTAEEYLERILLDTTLAGSQLQIWAGEELPKVKAGAYDDDIGLGVTEEASKKYGLLRPAVNLLVDEPEVFARLAADAYKDSRLYSSHKKVRVEARLDHVSSGSGSDRYKFSASLKEQVGPEGKDVYKTRLEFEYDVPQNGSSKKDETTGEHLENLMTLIAEQLDLEDEEGIRVSGNSLIIGKTNGGE